MSAGSGPGNLLIVDDEEEVGNTSKELKERLVKNDAIIACHFFKDDLLEIGQNSAIVRKPTDGPDVEELLIIFREERAVSVRKGIDKLREKVRELPKTQIDVPKDKTCKVQAEFKGQDDVLLIHDNDRDMVIIVGESQGIVDQAAHRVKMDQDSLPGGNIETLRAFIQTTRRLTTDVTRQTQGQTRNSRRRGPTASKLCCRYYLLPEGSEVPTLSGTRDMNLVAAHHQCRYGFPNGQDKFASCSLGLSVDAYEEFLRSLYPHVSASDGFHLYKSDWRKNLIEVEGGHDTLQKYTGVVFLKTFQRVDPGERLEEELVADVDSVSSVEQEQHTEPVQRQSEETAPQRPTEAALRPSSTVSREPIVPAPTSVSTVPQYPPVLYQPQHPSVLYRNQYSPVQQLMRQKNDGDDDDVIVVESPLERRRRIIIDQDIEFAASLRIDGERERSRREARQRLSLRRQHRRQQRNELSIVAEQDRQQQFQQLGNEPEDGVCLSFRLPKATLRRRFWHSDSCQMIYAFVKASTGQNCRIVGPEGPIPVDETSLEQIGISQNSVLNVESIDEDNEDSSEDCDDADDDTSGTHKNDSDIQEEVDVCKSFEDLKEQAGCVRDHLLPEKKIRVRRSEILDDLLDAYRADPDLIHHQVDMVIEDEPALDLNGVKREVFCSFFTSVMLKFFFGHEEKLPKMDPELLCSGIFELLGQIIAHAFVLVGYFPTQLSVPALTAILTATCNSTMAVSGYRKIVAPRLKKVLDKVLNGSVLNDNERLLFLSALSDHGFQRTPSSAEYRTALSRVAESCILYKPVFALGQLFRGLKVYGSLFRNINEECIRELYDKMTPNTQEVLRKISYEFSDDIYYRMAEEKVKQYLEFYIEEHLNEKGLKRLLKFWTASDTMIVEQLNVAFTSVEGVGRRPLVNACVAQLNLSRFYVNAEEFCEELDLYLNSDSAEVFDSF